MSEDKPPKPMPTAAEINAYLEQSAARTRMRLPLAKGQIVVQRGKAAPVDEIIDTARPLPASASRKLPLQVPKKLPTSAESADVDTKPAAGEAGWRPFENGDE